MGAIWEICLESSQFEQVQIVDKEMGTRRHTWYEIFDASNLCSLSSYGISNLLTMDLMLRYLISEGFPS